MVTWKQKKTALRLAVAKCLKLDVATTVRLADGTFENEDSEGVQFENERKASRPTRGIWCDLRLGSVVPISQDETRYDYDPDTDDLLPTYGGHRAFTVMVIVGSDDQEDAEAVGEVGSRLRTRIHRPDVQDILLAADLGYTSTLQTLNVDYADDGVMYSQSMTELRFETFEVDEPEGGIGYVGEVEGQGVPGGDLEDVHVQVGPV